MDFFEKEKLTALQAKEEAQWITFAPFVFQATRVLRDSGTPRPETGQTR